MADGVAEPAGAELPAAGSAAGLRKADALLRAALACVAGLGLLGAFTGIRVLDGIGPGVVPMAPSTAVLFLLLAALPLVRSCLSLRLAPAGSWAVFTLAAVAALNGLLSLGGEILGPMDALLRPLVRLSGLAQVRMSPATASLFTMSFASAGLLWLRADGRVPAAARAAGPLGGCVFLAGGVFLLGYAYGAPLLYGAGVVPMARSTALAFALLGSSLACQAGAGDLPLSLFAGQSPKALLMRAFVPLVMVLSLGHSLLHAGTSQEGTNGPLAASLITMVTAVAVGLAVTLAARRVGGSLERAEALRAGAEARVQQALEEKTVMLKELHHRVKNNMQIISSLLMLQSGYAHDPRDRELFEESQARIRSMALVHEDLYKSDDLSVVDMGRYVPRLVEHLTAGALPPVRLDLRVEDVRLPITQSVPCGMLLNELVLNARKHAFPGTPAPALLVRMRREDGEAVLEVADNGPGLPPGFSLSGGESFGLVLLGSLAEQLHGALSAGPAAGEGEAGTGGGGARFVLRFPLAEA